MKKKIIAGAAVLVVLGIVGFFVLGSAKGPGNPEVRTISLEKEDLTSSVSVTGTISSKDSTNVYSNLNYPVKTVHVSVGDVVTEGDILAELDTSNLETDIAQKKAAISASQASAQLTLEVAKADLETYKYNLENNYETNLLNAEGAVKTAEFALETASVDLVNARYNLREYRDNQEITGEDEYLDDTQLDTLKQSVTSREITYEKAKNDLEKAKATLEAIKVSSVDGITSYENKVKSAQLGTNFSDQLIALQKLETDLAKGVITAPVSGTVTAVIATEGGSGSGLLFVLQDSDSLKIITNIKEYDIGVVSVGNKVTIKSDATGDTEFEGVLSKIAPTSKTSDKGEVADTTDAEYESEVSVSSKQDGLLIGMKARMNIITEEKQGVYSVPYEAVGTDESGNSVIYIAKEQEDGTYIAEAVQVESGMETDLYVEIISDALTDGMQVIRDIQGIIPGMAIQLAQGSDAENGTPRGGMQVRMG